MIKKLIFRIVIIFEMLFNKTPLFIAAKYNNSDIVRFLLTIPDVNVNQKSIFE